MPLTDFSANINPLGVPEGVVSAIRDSIQKISAYPDTAARALCADIAAYEGVPESFVLCGNGASDIIFRLVFSLFPKKALVLAPTFSEYERAVLAVRGEVIFFNLQKRGGFAVNEAILGEITEECDILFLCNPNNPTGVLCERALLRKILERCAECDTLLVVDECFLDFIDNHGDYTMTGLLGEYKNLFVLKAFTKLYALPGLRLGYCLCSDGGLLQGINSAAQAWSVSILAQEAGRAALRESAYRAATTSLIAAERVYLLEGLMGCGARVFGSKANYIFFSHQNAGEIRAALYSRGILVRGCDNYRGLSERYCRVAVRSHPENERLLSAIQQIISDWSLK